MTQGRAIHDCDSVPQWLPKPSRPSWCAHGRSVPPPWLCLEGCPTTSRKQGLHFSTLLCACQSCHTCTESAFIRTSAEHFHIDIVIGGSLATINNRPTGLVINKSTEKKPQVRISFHMTLGERKAKSATSKLPSVKAINYMQVTDLSY